LRLLRNPNRGLQPTLLMDPSVPFPLADAGTVGQLLKRCPVARRTPLIAADELALASNVAQIFVKDERTRMGLGSFKALGAAYVIARDAAASGDEDLSSSLAGLTYVTASAGNHGLSVAAAARVFGARAVVFIAEAVPEAFARRLYDKGAEVVRRGIDYEASMAAAQEAANANSWQLLSDSSWHGYVDRPHRLMEGYLALFEEIADEIDEPPSHIFVQAGVGGLAGAIGAIVRARWRDAPTIVVVEPEAAPALFESIKAGRPVRTSGPASSMGRLDCKVPSLIALKGLARDADMFVTITEDEAAASLPVLARSGLETTASGAAGLAALLAAGPHREALKLTTTSRVLCILTESSEE
jgi:diaminopropionate ammonia-lyase